MQLTIEIPDELAAQLKTRADLAGISVESFVVESIGPTYVSTPSLEYLNLSPEEKARDFAEWANSHRDTPTLSLEAMSRESMYSDE